MIFDVHKFTMGLLHQLEIIFGGLIKTTTHKGFFIL
jgi:hypothetical protein